MALIKLGKYITQSDARNYDGTYDENTVVGLSTQKQAIKTKADLTGVNLTSYKLFPARNFAYVPDTSRRGDKVSLAYNLSNETYLVSSISVVFYVSDEEHLLPEYLYMYFNRPEFDRYARFNSWGSARETFSWEDMCDIDIELPDITVQQKYVDVYNAMLDNQRSYEQGLEDLKLVCDGYIDKLRHELPYEQLGKYIELSDQRNSDSKFGVDDVRGVSIEKKFIATKADIDGVSLTPYAIVSPKEFAYVTVTSRNGEKISIAYNDSNDSYICSSSYIVFRVTDQKRLLPAYLAMLFERDEFNRYARFHSWGSARETFDWDEMCDVQIPIPDITVQQYIVNIYIVYQLRKEINEQLKAQIKDLCPILIKGSIEEVSA